MNNRPSALDAKKFNEQSLTLRMLIRLLFPYLSVIVDLIYDFILWRCR